MAVLSKKSQMLAFDFTTGLFLFILIFLLFAGVFGISKLMEEKKAFDFEMEYVFDNLENNLINDPADPGGDSIFFSVHRVYPDKLADFASRYSSGQIADFDLYSVGFVGHAHGIGLEPAGYDTCLYLMDNTGLIEMGSGLAAIGRVRDGTSCDSKIRAGKNPCEDYGDVMSLFIPVLYDTGSPDTSRIVQMNMVVCKAI